MEQLIDPDYHANPTRTKPFKVAAIAGAIAVGAVISFVYAPWPSLAFVMGSCAALYFTEREEE